MIEKKIQKKIRIEIIRNFKKIILSRNSNGALIDQNFIKKTESFLSSNDPSYIEGNLSKHFSLLQESRKILKEMGIINNFYLFSKDSYYVIFTIFLFLSAFVLISTSMDINVMNSENNILNSHGIPLLYSLFFSIILAGLGASFKMIHLVIMDYKYGKSNFTFKIEYIVYGIVSGFILSEIIFSNIPMEDVKNIKLGKFLFAFFGGMAAELTFTIINKVLSVFHFTIKNKESEDNKKGL